MADHISHSDSHGTSPYNAVFIDTSLGTHLATIVSSSETVADLKKKVLHEPALCFPHIRDIKVHALKVKRRGKFYYLSESMLVKSVFHGLNRTWFISVDASSLEEHYENQNFPSSNDKDLLAPAGVKTVGLSNMALPEKSGSPEKLVSVADKQLHNDENLALNVAEGPGIMDIGVAITENNLGEAKSVDATDRSGPSMQKKGDYYEKEKKIQKSSIEGGDSSGQNDICDEPVSIPSEERAAGTKSTIKKKRKSKRKGKHDVDDFNSKEDNASLPESGINRSQNETVATEISLGNAHGIVSHDVSVENYDIIDGLITLLSSDANKATATIARRPAVVSEETGLLEKHAEFNSAESKKNKFDVRQDQSAEENSKLEPAAKRRRKSKRARKGDEDLLKDDGTLVSESNKALLEDSTISQNSQVDKQEQRDYSLHSSLVGTTESVHLQSVSPSGEKKRRRKKSAKTLNQETAAVPSSATDVELVSGHHVHDLISSEPDTVSLKEKHDEPIQEINLRPSSLEIDTSNKDDNVEGVCEASGSAITSNSERKKTSKVICAIAVENNPHFTDKTSDKTEKEKEVSGHGNMIHNVHQNHVTDQNDRVVEEQEFSINISNKSAPSEKCKTSAQDDIGSKTDEVVVASKLLEASDPVDPPRSSKKRKKSKKAKDLVSGAPSTSVTEHVEGYVSGTSPTEPHKAATGGLPGGTSNKEESNRLSKEGKEALQMDAMSNSVLATDKEINDVIQNVVDSVQQIGEDEVDTEIMHGKPRKKTRKKQRSDAKHLQESEKENEHVGKSCPALSMTNTGELNYSFKLTKDATLANTDAINQSIGSNMECGKEIMVENDLGSQSAQVQPHNPESDSEKRFPVAVMNVDPSKSGLESRGADDMEVSRETNGFNFNYYFAPRKHDLETVGPGEMLVDESNKTKGADDGMKTKKKKKKKQDTHSDGRLPEIHTSKNLNDSIGAKPQTGNSSTVEVRDSFKNAESEDIMLQPNKEPLKVSDTGAKALPSSKSHKFNSVPEEPRQSADSKPTGNNAHAKNKKTESNSGLESSKNSIFLKSRVDGHQALEDHNHIDGRKTSTINTGEVVNSSQIGKSLIGVSSSIFKDDIDGDHSGEDVDSDASTRTPSNGSLSSDYSDGESNADSNLTQNGSYSLRRRGEGGKTVTKPLSSGMSLDVILRSSSRYKKAKLTASQSQLEDAESQPVDFVPESQPNP